MKTVRKKKRKFKPVYAPFPYRSERKKRNRLKTKRERINRQERPPEHSPELNAYSVNERDLVIMNCRDSFFCFMKEFWATVDAATPVWNWHIEYICNEMQELAERVFRGEISQYDLLVNIAPGTTKSLIISVMFPAWVWTRMPEAQIIGVSYSDPLATDLSSKCRDIVMSEQYQDYFPEVKWRADQNTKTFFKNTKGGWRYCAGVNGTVTGKHAHFILIDDPLNPNEAGSTADLAAANRWISETLSSRKVNKGVTVTVLVMQRLHEDDPAANFKKRKKVRYVCLPAEITKDVHPPELKERYIDGLMDPVRLNWAALEEAKDQGEFYYASQFLQTPVPREGGQFKPDLVKFGIPPKVFKKIVRYWDKAGTRGGGAFTVGTRIGKDMDGRIWVLDVRRFQHDSAERERIIKSTAIDDGPDVDVIVEQEGGSGGKDSARATVVMLAGISKCYIDVVSLRGNKEDRADFFSVQMNVGNVYVPEGSPWFPAWKNEFTFFPNSKYKDQVDSASGGFTYIHKKKKRAGRMWKH